MITMTRISLDTAEGKKFLRRVKTRKEDWSAKADKESEWNLEFFRTVKGEVGDPDEEVIVQTDCKIAVDERDFGIEKKNQLGTEETPVTVPHINRIRFEYDSKMRLLCKSLLDGMNLEVVVNRGSINSRQHGVAMISVRARCREYEYPIGWDTWIVDGRCVCLGSAHVSMW